MGSTRLPGKVMKKLLDKEIVLWSYERCLKSKVDKVIIATSINKENDVLENLFLERGIDYYRGSENDLLDRYYKLASKYDDGNLKIIRVTSDCPFVDYDMINEMILFYERGGYDYVINHSERGITPEGSGIEIVNYGTLKYLWENEEDGNFREHATGMLRKSEKYFDKIKMGEYEYYVDGVDVNRMKMVKVSVDTEGDYERSLRIVDFFGIYDFSYGEILKNYNRIFNMGKTEQEEFWIGEFGDEYTDRNNDELFKNKYNFFSNILGKIDIGSVFEIGCNRGINLDVINRFNGDIDLYGLEINKKASDIILAKNICKKVYNNSIFDVEILEKFDLVFTLGVLIHINPDKLSEIYSKMYNLSEKYILIGEYYSRNVQEIPYRGNSNKLFKRDFCGEMMNLYPNLKLVDYGFVYHRDQNFPLDDITWFLLEK